MKTSENAGDSAVMFILILIIFIFLFFFLFSIVSGSSCGVYARRESEDSPKPKGGINHASSLGKYHHLETVCAIVYIGEIVRQIEMGEYEIGNGGGGGGEMRWKREREKATTKQGKKDSGIIIITGPQLNNSEVVQSTKYPA